MFRTFSKSILALSLAAILLGAVSPAISHAQSTGSGSAATVSTGNGSAATVSTGSGSLFPNLAKGNGTICSFLIMLLNLVTEIGAIIGVLAIIAVGFYFVWAQGKEEKLKTAKWAFLWTVIGVMLLLGASVIGHILITTVNAVLTAGGNNLPNQSDLTCSP